MSNYLRGALGPVPQTEAADPMQVPNSAGGHSFAVDDWGRLARFLILGSEGGSYYASERKLTLENAKAVERCVALDGPRVVRIVEAYSLAGRAPKAEPGLMALAIAAKKGDDLTRKNAFAAVQSVCRTGTHLFHFAAFLNELGGWGRGTRRAIGNWYQNKTVEDLAYQLVKYQQRDRWSHRDLLRLSHPRPDGEAKAALYKWATHGFSKDLLLPEIVVAHETAQKLGADPATVAWLIRTARLPREAVPSEALTSPAVWEALLDAGMPITAMIRNLATMTRVGLLAPGSNAVGHVVARLRDAEHLKKGRVHPIAVLSALRTYQRGHGVRGQHTWTPVPAVVDALDAAFYGSFGAIRGAGRNTMLALDVSGSMSSGEVAGVPGLTPRDASCAMAMVTAAVEPSVSCWGFSDRFRSLDISPRRRLDDNIRVTSGLPFESTDCSLPMEYALQHKLNVETFVVYTDSETYAGRRHPHVALQDYRRKTGILARLVVVGMVSNGFTIADPGDAGMLDVVGFDTATPGVITDFSMGLDTGAEGP